MKTALAYLLALVFTVFGCENYDQATKGAQKAKEFIGNAEKQITETKQNAEKSLGKLFGSDTGSSENSKSDHEESDADKNKED